MSRNLCIDYLRFIGLSLIILAHVNPPRTLFHIRCFDVSLMLFVSGLAYSGRKPDFSWLFFWKRFKRLIVPVYIFLTVYFVFIILVESLGINLGFKKEYVLGSFLLTGGIGYVWIIRVFLMVAVLTPFLQKVDIILKSTIVYTVVIVCLMLLIDLLIKNDIGVNDYFIRQYLYYAIGYSALFLLGLRAKRQSTIETLSVLVFIVIVLFGYIHIWGGDFWLVNNYKYPPQFYYLFYGGSISLLLYLFMKRKKYLRPNGVLLFIAQNSIWIYLFHIPMVQIVSRFSLEWFIKYPIVYFVTVSLCFLQTRTVEWLSCKYGQRAVFKYLKG